MSTPRPPNATSRAAGTNQPNQIVLGLKGKADKDGSDVFTVAPQSLRNHTLIVGQSGSGKSTFLTRLIEEIASRTLGRLLILDPNGDYQRLHKIDWPGTAPVGADDRAKQKAARFHTMLASLADYESNRGIVSLDREDDFRRRWDEVAMQYLGWTFETGQTALRRHTSPYVAWCYMDRDDKSALLAFDATEQPELYRAFTALDDYLFQITDPKARPPADDPAGLREFKENKYNLQYDLNSVIGAADHLAEQAPNNDLIRAFPGISAVGESWRNTWKHVAAVAQQVSKRFKVWEPYVADGGLGNRQLPAVHIIVENGMERKQSYDWSICVIGLLQLAIDRFRVKTQDDALLLVDAVLSKLWRSATLGWYNASTKGRDNRIPTFVVLDEAQLFAPEEVSSPLQRRVRDKLVRIAGEGRKYGIYLILSTQRPSKLHKGLLYECENQAFLRLQSPSELQLAQSAFRIDAESQSVNANEIRGFDRPGQCLIKGRWVDLKQDPKGYAIIRSGPRRTEEGGKDLIDDIWVLRSDPVTSASPGPAMPTAEPKGTYFVPGAVAESQVPQSPAARDTPLLDPLDG